MHITEKRIEIKAPVERVFDFFSDFESFPRWMKNIKEVRYTGRRFTRWTAEAPLGTEVEWESETTHFEPDHRIAWRSVRGDVDTEGEVIFEETRRGTTLMRVVLGYALPAGRLGEMVARLFGKNPEHQLEDDLARFAAVVEGRRSGARRQRDDDAERERDERRRREERANIKGSRQRMRRQENDDVREPRFDDRRAFAERDRRERDYYAPGGERDYEGETPRRERNAREGFEDAIRAARRSQLEGQRRYAAERVRREHERSREPRYAEEYERGGGPRRFDEERYGGDGRRGAFPDEREERWQSEEERREREGRREESSRREADARYDDAAEREARRRHALTPREREMERERGREPDYGYSEEAFRRGVDKLMDEPPSRRWRRWE